MTSRTTNSLPALALIGLLAACGQGNDDGTTADNSVETGEPASTDTPTWYQDIQPIVYKKCGSCHRPDAIAPFSVLDYSTARAFAMPMLRAVEEGRMPPFLARETPECTPKHKYANDPRLSADERATLRAWAMNGAPAGDENKAAELEEPPPTNIERADVVMRLPEPITVVESDQGDLHTCVVVDPGIEEDGYVVSRQVTSGNAKVLHHVTTYIVRPEKTDGTKLTRAEVNDAFLSAKGVNIGERYDCFGGPTLDATGLGYSLLGSWAPGGQPVRSPPESGQPVKAGSIVVLDMHYHPIPSGPETDSDTEYSLQFADSVPRFIANPIFMGFADAKQQVHVDSQYGIQNLLKQPGESEPEFVIPADASDHVEEWTFKWKLPLSPLKIYFASSHMHYAGRDLMVSLENGTPAEGEDPMECLEHTPEWDFNWQMGYGWDTSYENLPTIHDGDTIHVRCVYDNTMKNRAIANALELQGLNEPVDILVGEDTLDEMCLSLMGISYPNAAFFEQSGATP
jgi:Copper type II ascorbate-dependent monooxygenase, C-terminal domain